MLILAGLIYFLDFALTGADIITVNSGTGTNLTVTPDQYLGGTFNNPGFPSGGEVVPPVTPPSPPGGGAAGNVTYPSLKIVPGQFNINMIVNTNVHQIISITNIGTSATSVAITQSNLNNMIIVENTSIYLAPGETKSIGVIFVAPNTTGVYNGTINIGNVGVPVSLNVLKEFILFDSNIVVLNRNYQVSRGQPLQTQVTLIPMGTPVRMDVTLNYAIKSSNGTVYLTRSETLLVDSQQSVRRDFDTGSLPLGGYVVELELVYPYGIAPSSAHFDIVESVRNLFSIAAYGIIFAIIMISALLIVLTMVRLSKKNRQINYEPQVSEY
jgi:hypothetical protein